MPPEAAGSPLSEHRIVAQWRYIDDVGPIIHIARSEGTVSTDSGEKVGTISAQADESVQGVRMTIIALHVGPVTATADGGEVDETGAMNRSVLDMGGEILLISQFTLFASTKKGTKPISSRPFWMARSRSPFRPSCPRSASASYSCLSICLAA